MRKILWVLLMLLVLTACGAEPAPETAPPPVEVEIPYVEETLPQLPYEGVALTFRSIWREDDAQSQVLRQAAAFFERKTGATVEIRWLEDEAETADLFQIPASEFTETDPAQMLDLTEMSEKSGYSEKSHEALRTQIVDHCGYLGAVAQTPYLGGVYYNADIFTNCGITEAPRSWAEFEDVAETLRIYGWQPLTLDKEDAIAAMELHLRRSIGRELMLKYMGKKDHWHFDQTVVAAMEQVMIFAQSGYMTYGTPADYPAGQNKMGISNSAMMVGTNGDCADIEEETCTDLRWGMFPYPGEKESGTWMEADMAAIHPDCENPQAAFDFLMLLVTGEFDQLRTNISGGIPSDPANTSPIAGAMEALQAAQPQLLDVFGYKQTDPAVKLWSGWYDEAERYAIALERSK